MGLSDPRPFAIASVELKSENACKSFCAYVMWWCEESRTSACLCNIVVRALHITDPNSSRDDLCLQCKQCHLVGNG